MFTACSCPAKKSGGRGKSAGATVELVEGEEEVINLQRIEGAMSASINALKHEYTTSVTARITPGMCMFVHLCMFVCIIIFDIFVRLCYVYLSVH